MVTQAPRRAAEVNVADGMLFEAPSERAWRVLVGVVDALALRLDPAAFAEAVDALAAYADGFPDDLRRCPQAWINIFFDEAPDPRLKLVRRLTLHWSTFGWSAKSFASWTSSLAKTPHLSGLTTIDLFSMQTGKAAITALVALFTAARPSRWRILNGKRRFEQDLVAALGAAGVVAERIMDYPADPRPPERVDAAALDDAEVRLKIQDDEAFAAIMARDDLDHVTSLDLEVDFGWAAARPETQVQAVRARWERLRYLSVRIQGSEGGAPIAASIVDWLQDARPICVEANEDKITTPLIQRGVFSRALGAELRMHDLAEAREALSAGLVRVMGLIHAENTPYLEGTMELLSRLHPDTRAALRVLDWGLPEAELSQIEEICAALPSLVIWCPHDAALTDQRGAFIEQLAASPSSQKVRLLIPYEPYRGGSEKTPALAARDAKRLEKGQGLRSSAYVVYNHSAYPYRITW